jgi:hypothetical protein
LAGVGSLATFELGVVNGTAIGSRHGVDTLSVGPSEVKVGIPGVGSSRGGGRDGGRSGEHGKTGSRSLLGVLSLATFELGVINDGSAGGGESVDTVTIGVVDITIGVVGINSSSSSRGDGRRSGEVGKTGSRSLGSVLALAAVKLSIVDSAAVGSRHGVLTNAIGKVHIKVGVPGIRSSRGSGGSGRRSRQHTVALAGRLAGKGGITAGKLGGVSLTSLGEVVVGGTPSR